MSIVRSILSSVASASLAQWLALPLRAAPVDRVEMQPAGLQAGPVDRVGPQLAGLRAGLGDGRSSPLPVFPEALL